MTKTEFLARLENGLVQLPKEERQSNIDYYSELIDDMIEEGMTEDEATAKLGDPYAIAHSILEEMPIDKLVRDRVRPAGGWTALAIVLAVIGSPVWLPILLALFAVVVSIVVAIWAVVIAVFAVMAALIVAGIAILVGLTIGAVNGAGTAMFFLGAALIVIAAGILVGIAGVYAVKLAAKGCAALWRGIKSLFIKKEK